jgi:pyochelin biosynthesis protein PchC
MKIFTLAHAGGSARGYRRLFGDAPGFAIQPLEMAGRGTRWREQPLLTIPAVARDLLPTLGGDFVLFGHSLGALVAYELARQAQLSGRRPRLLVVSGRNPPHRPPDTSQLSQPGLSDAELFANLVKLGGAVARGAGPLTYETFLPTLRADLLLAGDYLPLQTGPLLTCPVLVLSGADDPLTTDSDLEQWRRYTSGPCAVRSFPGGHFFLEDHAAQILAAIGSMLEVRT